MYVIVVQSYYKIVHCFSLKIGYYIDMSLDDWMPSNTSGFFSVDPHIDLPNGYRIEPSIYISDIARRSWWERLFTRPWRPLVKSKSSPTAYIVDKTILVSWSTYNELKAK